MAKESFVTGYSCSAMRSRWLHAAWPISVNMFVGTACLHVGATCTTFKMKRRKDTILPWNFSSSQHFSVGANESLTTRKVFEVPSNGFYFTRVIV
ncbi:hypothetical protein OUZ56_028281 [Daphnia magna]|uniref:Uncharacterized protein n=1 Tax=Daphnia magna TaxID=35525 RepID=A0ABR0B3D5_9CRUS|nr:hypothetical protein OUZ56_028281 [Daphnia magna]